MCLCHSVSNRKTNSAPRRGCCRGGGGAESVGVADAGGRDARVVLPDPEIRSFEADADAPKAREPCRVVDEDLRAVGRRRAEVLAAGDGRVVGCVGGNVVRERRRVDGGEIGDATRVAHGRGDRAGDNVVGESSTIVRRNITSGDVGDFVQSPISTYGSSRELGRTWTSDRRHDGSPFVVHVHSDTCVVCCRFDRASANQVRSQVDRAETKHRQIFDRTEKEPLGSDFTCHSRSKGINEWRRISTVVRSDTADVLSAPISGASVSGGKTCRRASNGNGESAPRDHCSASRGHAAKDHTTHGRVCDFFVELDGAISAGEARVARVTISCKENSVRILSPIQVESAVQINKHAVAGTFGRPVGNRAWDWHCRIRIIWQRARVRWLSGQTLVIAIDKFDSRTLS